jgi:hypothetical protein
LSADRLAPAAERQRHLEVSAVDAPHCKSSISLALTRQAGRNSRASIAGASTTWMVGERTELGSDEARELTIESRRICRAEPRLAPEWT